MGKRCFIVHPRGEIGSAAWKRSEQVLNEYLVPACQQAGFDPITFDEIDGKNDDQAAEIRYHLRQSPMVLADLAGGTGGWNPNVMMEAGYRHVMGSPIIFVRDTPVGGLPHLPFLLLTHPIIEIPPSDVTRDQPKVRDKYIKKIADKMVDKYGISKNWHSPHALALVEVDISSHPPHATFVGSTTEADRLLGFGEDLVGVDSEKLADVVTSKMPDPQRKPFEKDQENVYNALFEFGPLRGDNVVSNIPLTFAGATDAPDVSALHPIEEFCGKSFMPIIVQREKITDTKYWVRVLYLDVSNSVYRDAEGVYHYSQCTECRRLGESVGKTCAAAPATFSSLLSEREYQPVLFIYNSADENFVTEVREQFSLKGLDPWFAPSLEGGVSHLSAFHRAVENAVVVVLFVSREGPGPWQKKEVEFLVTRHVENNLVIIPVLLTGATGADLHALAPHLAGLHRVDFNGARSWEDSVMKLLGAVFNILLESPLKRR